MPVKNKFLPLSIGTLLMVNKYSEPKNLLYKDTIQNLFKINITLSIPITYIFKSLMTKCMAIKDYESNFIYQFAVITCIIFFG